MAARELQDILRTIQVNPRASRAGVLATLVSVRGSTYRRPGARMLIIDTQRVCGTISGGCLEAEVCRQARELGQTPRVIEFNTFDPDDALLGYSMGCRGVIHILLQRIDAGDTHWRDIQASLDAGELCCLATVCSGPDIGRQYFLSDVSEDVPSNPALSRDMRAAMNDCKWRHRAYEFSAGKADVFVEPIIPPVALVLFGGGPDAAPVADIANILGWHVTVVDPRPSDALRARFPHARQIIESTPAVAVARLRFTPRTAAVLMMHNYAQDVELLAALPADTAYVGLLGPRHRSEQLTGELERRGSSLRRFSNLYTPVGLDVGATTPDEIALAIVAEVQAVMSRRGGGYLRDRAAGIHDPPLPAESEKP